MMKRLFAVAVIGMTMAGCTDPIPGIATGVWGGNGLVMTVTDSGAVLQFNCAGGKITVPLDVNAQGEGQWSGTYTRMSPVAGTPPDTAHPATYFATVHGTHMTILPSVPDLLIEFVSVDLEQGNPGQIALCP